MSAFWRDRRVRCQRIELQPLVQIPRAATIHSTGVGRIFFPARGCLRWNGDNRAGERRLRIELGGFDVDVWLRRVDVWLRRVDVWLRRVDV